MRYCPHCGEPLDGLELRRAQLDPLGEAFMAMMTDLGASFVETPAQPAQPCPECGLTIGHWSRCSHLRDGIYQETED